MFLNIGEVCLSYLEAPTIRAQVQRTGLQFAGSVRTGRPPREYIMSCKYTKSLFWPRKNPGCAILLAEKAPAGMGTPRPGFAKLRFGLGLARARIA